MTAEYDAVVEAMARAICVSQGGEPDFMMSAAVIGLPDYPQWTEYGGEATAAYDAALPLIVGPLRELAEPLAGQWHGGSEPKTFDQGVGAMAQDLLARLDALPSGEHEPQCECEMGWQCDFCRQFSRGYNGGDA